MFLTPEDLSQPSGISIPEDEDPPGLILPTGEINWSCPCLGGMATGPCGVEFREAFTCFHFRYLLSISIPEERATHVFFHLQHS